MTPEEPATRLACDDPTAVLDAHDRDKFAARYVGDVAVTVAQAPAVRFTQVETHRMVGELAAELRDAPSPVVVVCVKGRSGDHVAGLLSEAGTPAENLETGMDGWACVYHAHDLPAGDADGDRDATVLQRDHSFSGCFAYPVVVGDEAVVVDPLRAFMDRYVVNARECGAEVVAAVDTYVHTGHVDGVRTVVERTDATLVPPAGATGRGLDFDARPVDNATAG